MTLKEFAEENNIPVGCIYYLRRAYTGDEYTKRLSKLQKIDFTVGGRRFTNLQEIARHFYLPLSDVYALLDLDMSLEEAVESVVKSRSITYNEVTYYSLKHLCAELNLKHKLVRDRIKLGWSLERAITQGKVLSKSHRVPRKKVNKPKARPLGVVGRLVG
jgi:hypothetical protein